MKVSPSDGVVDLAGMETDGGGTETRDGGEMAGVVPGVGCHYSAAGLMFWLAEWRKVSSSAEDP